NFLVDNVPMILDNEVELSNVLEPKETSAINTREVLHPLAPSVQKRLTTAIRNRKRSISNKLLQDKININITLSKKTVIQSALEDLFVEKVISWKR
ncbi:1894_t:CDS:2, partial [Gigaspora rosea]